MRAYKSWSGSETEFLKTNYGCLTAKEIASTLGRSELSIYEKASVLGLRKQVLRRPLARKLRNGELLRRLYLDEGLAMSEIARKLGCSKKTVERTLAIYEIPKRTRQEGKKRVIIRKRGGLDVVYTDEEKRLLALAIDLEGSIFLAKNNKIYSPAICIANTSYELLSYIQLLARVGSIYNQRKETERWKHSWFWDVSSVFEIKHLLEQISPYFIAKKKQAELLLEFCNIRVENFDRPPLTRELEIYLALKELNRRGATSSKTAFSRA